MPSLGADMTEGTLLEWFVHPGDTVHRGDIVAVVDTSKSAIDIEVFEDGVVEQLLVEPGTTIDVGHADGDPRATRGVRTAARRRPDPCPCRRLSRRLPPAPAPAPAAAPAPAPAPRPPRARTCRRRRWRGGRRTSSVSTSPSIRGTGSGGAVTMADVEAAGERRQPRPPRSPLRPHPAPVPAATRPGMHPQAMRDAIGALMARSKKEIPHYYLQATIDMERSLTWLEHANAQRSVSERILPAALLLKSTAMAVHEVPEMNGFLVDGVFTPSTQVHLGVAVSLRGGGLIAPALHDVDTLSLDTVMAALKDLGGRARGGKLRSSEMSDPTLTVTNLGDQGVDLVHGVIYPPQVALVGFGRIHAIPVAIDGMLAVHRCVLVTLAADHRVSDGHRGGLFLSAIDAALQKPEEL